MTHTQLALDQDGSTLPLFSGEPIPDPRMPPGQDWEPAERPYRCSVCDKLIPDDETIYFDHGAVRCDPCQRHYRKERPK
jgi:hypothetical protein